MFLAVSALDFADVGFEPSTKAMIPVKAKCTISYSSSPAGIEGVGRGGRRPGCGDGDRAMLGPRRRWRRPDQVKTGARWPELVAARGERGRRWP